MKQYEREISSIITDNIDLLSCLYEDFIFLYKRQPEVSELTMMLERKQSILA